ncbi:MAG: zinc ABC transporter substrate-binding protein, partial [Pseudomonadota bacterium]
MRLLTATALTLGLGTAAAADAPRVVTDIAPIHGLVAMVMEGVGSPTLILPPGASPHGYAMRPSEAAALAEAEVVFWTGEDLAPWFARSAGSLAPDATKIALLEVEGLPLLPYREGARFEAHDHDHEDHGHGDHDEHAHGDHDDHGHEAHDHDEHAHGEEHAEAKDHDDHAHGDHDHDEHAHDHDDHAHGEEHAEAKDHEDHAHGDHAHDHDEQAHGEEHAEAAHEEHGHDDHAHEEHAHGDHDHGHDHGAFDPHAWLDPAIARLWLGEIADTLAAADPDGAATYRANADAAIAALTAQEAAIAERLAPITGKPFIVFHDAYQYFELRFGLEASGAISPGDASSPGA